jgi:hypothetical protein
MTGFRNLGMLILAVVVAAGCTTTIVRDDPTAPVAAQLSVERFLQAANQRDVRAMGYLFGTRDGPWMETGSTFGCAFKKIGSWFGGTACRKERDIEVQMDAIASILGHEDYRVVREERVPGRLAPTRRVLVDMTVQGDPVPEVPFEVVQTDEGRWLIQSVDLEHVMTRGR